MKFLPLSERSDEDIQQIVELARETSIGSALYTWGFSLKDLQRDPLGHLRLSIMLDPEDLKELTTTWQRYLETGTPVMSVSVHKGGLID